MSREPQSDHSGPDRPVYRLERRKNARRHAPAACADCERPIPPYVYLEDGKNYCVECALLVVETERIYPAGRRKEDVTLGELVRERLRVLPRVPLDRRAEPASQDDARKEPKSP
jgi:hypothetical protein